MHIHKQIFDQSTAWCVTYSCHKRDKIGLNKFSTSNGKIYFHEGLTFWVVLYIGCRTWILATVYHCLSHWPKRMVGQADEQTVVSMKVATTTKKSKESSVLDTTLKRSFGNVKDDGYELRMTQNKGLPCRWWSKKNLRYELCVLRALIMAAYTWTMLLLNIWWYKSIKTNPINWAC